MYSLHHQVSAFQFVFISVAEYLIAEIADDKKEECERYPRVVRSRNPGIYTCSDVNQELPENFLAWHPTCHDHDEAAMPLADTFVNSTDEELRLFYIWGHSFELDKDDMDRWQAMEKLCAFLAESFQL